MPLYTPVGGSWLNMAELIERVLKRRALDGQHPHSPAEIGSWFEQTAQRWNEQPTPFVWNGKRRQRRCRPGGDQTHRLGGSGACTPRPLRRNRATGASECQIPRQSTHLGALLFLSTRGALMRRRDVGQGPAPAALGYAARRLGRSNRRRRERRASARGRELVFPEARPLCTTAELWQDQRKAEVRSRDGESPVGDAPRQECGAGTNRNRRTCRVLLGPGRGLGQKPWAAGTPKGSH